MIELTTTARGNTIKTRMIADGDFEGSINGLVVCFTARRSTAAAIAQGLEERLMRDDRI